MFNCLIINKLHKILSTIILYDDLIIIYNNICLNSHNKINIVRSETTHSLWTKNNENFEKELNEFLIKNEEEIKKEIYLINNDKSKQKKKNLNEFCYNKSYKFSKKIINLKKINEIHKRQHLHISNSIEIFKKNGESYFIVLNPEDRDCLFDKIISKINDIYKNKKNKLEIFKHSKIESSNDKDNYFYIKHCPVLSLNQSQEADSFLKNQKKKKNISQNFNGFKILMDGNILKDKICDYWCKNKVSNYEYLMLLNTLGGRTLNDLSQYFIFPWIIKDFNKDILNWLSDSIYRDLSLPIHACGEDKERIINKYELLDDEKYHSGTFYSTHSFVCYFLIRQRPFTEIHLEIQGSKFDAPARMFNGVEQLSNITEKYQELIPALFNLPELYIKTSFIFDNNEINKEPINDYILPNWTKNDPRKFTLILKKLLESKKVSSNLNLWIDLIFGYKQKGLNAIKALNIYRNACYSTTKIELEKMENNNELETYMYEKEELGGIGKQLFTKAHKSKELNNEKNKNNNIFFNDNDKLKNLRINKIKNQLIRNNNIQFNKISDIIFPINSPFNINKNKRTYYQGGISSLSNIMHCLNCSGDNHSKNLNKKKLMKLLTEENNFILLNKKYKYLRDLNLIVTYDKKYIELINIINNESYFYFLNEINDITCLTTNEKGTLLYIGFSNGNINIYKIIDEKLNGNNKIISTFYSQINDINFENKNIFKNNEINKQIFVIIEKNKEKNLYLELKTKNKFSYNNPHVPKKLKLISLNEYHNVLITLDESNFIYIISLNNECKLMHTSLFLSNTKYKMKEIIPLSWNGDFIIYSSYTIYLFNINGIPLCQLNLFDKIYENLYSITCCKAIFLDDITLFTGHKDGSIIIWKIKNKDITQKFDERVSYIFNRKKTKSFLSEYSYGYDNKYLRNNKFKINEYELQRKFENVNQIQNLKSTKKNFFNFMKISNDLDYMILFDNEKNMYILTDLENESKNINTNKRKSKNLCFNCLKPIIDEGIRPTLINKEDIDNKKNEFENIINEKAYNGRLICEECKQKLKYTENFLYNY